MRTLLLVPLCLAFLLVAPVNATADDSKSDKPAKQTNKSANGVDESKILKGLASDDPRKVMNALGDLEEQTSPSTNAIIVTRKLLTDPRPSVRRKAARVLGQIHAPVESADLQAICRMLKSFDKGEADDALKALRGLKAEETVPEIVPFLKSPQDVLARDACRTLAMLGNKDQIPVIEPLLKHQNRDVRLDAQEAITALREKN